MYMASIFSAATAISLDTAGSMVLESMSSVPFFTFLKNRRMLTAIQRSLDVERSVNLLRQHYSTILYSLMTIQFNSVYFCPHILKYPVGSCVNLYDVGAGWQHGDDAVGSFGHISRAI